MHKQVDRKPMNGSGGCMGKGIGLPQSLFIIQVVPYWGNAQDRKILRKFWDSKSLHTESASFHVVITSYQLVIQDVKYFQRIKWQYLVLDEAQAIKSTSRSALSNCKRLACNVSFNSLRAPCINPFMSTAAIPNFLEVSPNNQLQEMH